MTHMMSSRFHFTIISSNSHVTIGSKGVSDVSRRRGGAGAASRFKSFHPKSSHSKVLLIQNNHDEFMEYVRYQISFIPLFSDKPLVVRGLRAASELWLLSI